MDVVSQGSLQSVPRLSWTSKAGRAGGKGLLVLKLSLIEEERNTLQQTEARIGGSEPLADIVALEPIQASLNDD